MRQQLQRQIVKLSDTRARSGHHTCTGTDEHQAGIQDDHQTGIQGHDQADARTDAKPGARVVLGWRRLRLLSASTAALGLCLAALTGCGGAATSSTSASGSAGLAGYLREVEPIRLAVNSLLERADPILEAFRSRRIPAATAAARMAGLERRFAAYTVEIAAIEPATPELRALHAPYARTYILEDAYLSALVSGLGRGQLSGLPDTQSAQRAAIIGWRTGLTVLARRLGLALPADLQQAGRGEIAPSVLGS